MHDSVSLTSPSTIALIPARSGSKRVSGKNVRLLDGHPMMAYTIRAAIDSGVFQRVVVSTDSEQYAEIARHYGADVPFLRPPEYSGDKSPDIEWIKHALDSFANEGQRFDSFSILRPTSPFRLPETIRRAWAEFLTQDGIDSLRAVEKCTQHPGKMWVIRGRVMTPILPFLHEGTPWHSTQYAALPEVYVQNASLEIAWSRVLDTGTISGSVIYPFLTKDSEGMDINQELDWSHASNLLEKKQIELPVLSQPPFAG
jgi:CMP-N,N'-diacetyllegionaminic acid synthase